MGTFDRYELWNTSDLLTVLRETEEVPNYWRNLLFPSVFTSTDEYIDLEKVPALGRKLAPFVAPMAQGRPIYEEGTRAQRFKPSYVKALDPVTPQRSVAKRVGSLFTQGVTTQAARYDSIKADILAYHRNAVERTWEWLAARAILDGKVTIADDDMPTYSVDFGRDSTFDVVLGPGARWGDAGVSIIDFFQSAMDTMQRAQFSGVPDRATIGVSAWAVMRKDQELMKLMDKNTANSNVDIQRGLIPAGQVRRVGSLGTGLLDIWVYNDWYTVGRGQNTVVTPFMSPKEVLLSGPNVQGFQCFGAIQDFHAGFEALPVYPRNFATEGDPAMEHLLTQSAPLMVPVNPNATFRARVLA